MHLQLMRKTIIGTNLKMLSTLEGQRTQRIVIRKHSGVPWR